MAKIGLKKFYYAPLTKDDETGVTYGTPKRIMGINSIDINPTVQKATAYGDDVPMATASSISEIVLRISTVDLPLEDKAALLGHKMVDGVMESSTDAEPPYVAVMCESKTHDGKIQYEKFLKGKFSETQETINTKGENIEYQLPEIEGSFVAREYDGKWRKTTVTTDTTVATSWYASVEA